MARRNVFEAVGGESLGICATGRARNGRLPARLQRSVRDPPYVPQLHHELAALGVHGIGDPAPAPDLLAVVNARRIEVALAGLRNLRGLRNDQSGAGALFVVGRHQVGGYLTRAGAVPSQRCHDDSICGLNVSDVYRVKQRRHRVSPAGIFLYSLQHASALRSCPCTTEPSGDAKRRDDKSPVMMVARDQTLRYSR